MDKSDQSSSLSARHIVFFTGAPGSRWSAVSQAVGLMPQVNHSDENPSRLFHHLRFSGHKGMYFGPGMELGKKFDRLSELSREDILSEIDSAYEDKNTEQLRIIKAHIFSYQLDELKKKFPESQIMMVWRSDEESIKWWFDIGGFSIQYPKYDWYVDEPTMKKRIVEENKNIKGYCLKNNLELEPFNAAWIKKYFGRDVVLEDPDYFKNIFVAITK